MGGGEKPAGRGKAGLVATKKEVLRESQRLIFQQEHKAVHTMYSHESHF